LVRTISPDDAEILRLEDRRYTSVLQQDYGTLEALCHPELVYGHSAGNRDSLETYLAKLRGGSLRYHRIEHPVESILVLGDSALVLGSMNAELTVSGVTKTLNNTCLAVWTRITGSWKFIAYQPTPCP
jgi:hypothetical protein